MRNFKKILAWQKADDLTVAVYKVTKAFPDSERFSMVNQMRRSAYSVPANIAEGASRNTPKDYLNFLYIARGSLSELSYFIHLSLRLKYLSIADHEKLASQADETGRTLTGLIKAVTREAG